MLFYMVILLNIDNIGYVNMHAMSTYVYYNPGFKKNQVYKFHKEVKI